MIKVSQLEKDIEAANLEVQDVTFKISSWQVDAMNLQEGSHISISTLLIVKGVAQVTYINHTVRPTDTSFQKRNAERCKGALSLISLQQI